MPFSAEKRQTERNPSPQRRDAVINGVRFRIYDISLEGLGVVLENEFALVPGQRIDRIELVTPNNRARTLKGIVSHITRTTQHVICGLRFDFSSPEDLKFVAEFKATACA